MQGEKMHFCYQDMTVTHMGKSYMGLSTTHPFSKDPSSWIRMSGDDNSVVPAGYIMIGIAFESFQKNGCTYFFEYVLIAPIKVVDVSFKYEDKAKALGFKDY